MNKPQNVAPDTPAGVATITGLKRSRELRAETKSGANAAPELRRSDLCSDQAAGRQRPPISIAKVSIVVPVYNEAESIPQFLLETRAALRDRVGSLEFVFVDDGSRDTTLPVLLAQRSSDKSIKIVQLSRNFGKELALSAGLEYASGDAVIPMDVDLQDPPAVIPELLAKWADGYDVIYAVRAARKRDSFIKRWSARLFYSSFNAISETAIPENAGDFRLMDRRVVDVIRSLPEHNRFMKGLFSWVGFKQTSIAFERPERCIGESKWNYWKLWNFAIDGVCSFSTVPLKLWSYIGVLVSMGAFAYAAFLFIRTLVLGVEVPGYASLMVVMLFLGGVQLLSLGIIGEYLGRLYSESKRRPLYLVAETWGVESEAHGN